MHIELYYTDSPLPPVGKNYINKGFKGKSKLQIWMWSKRIDLVYLYP
jgi:hypothetical protein